MLDWNSAQYLKFKKERTQPAIDLASKINLNLPAKIIDIGCGPGNSTAVLKKCFPSAELLGVDYSADMLNRAHSEIPDVAFKQLDITQNDWHLDTNFDIAFSNACIQWVPNHKTLLPKIMSILNVGGKMAIQIPINYEEPIHKIICNISANQKWHDKFPNKRVFYTLTINEYYDILSDISSDFEIWSTTYCHRMKSHESIIEWYRSTGLKPYLDALDDDGKKDFTYDILNEVKKQYPIQKNGEIIFRFPRLFFIATK